MPTTINGIGTHYYGKSNLAARSGACQSCGRVVDLQSYDTRLWFVFVFIPIIPLGRKRIIDQCSACSRHYVADQAEFAKAQNEALAESLEQYLAKPSAEAAIAVHADMLGFGAQEDARAFRDEVLPRYSNDAQLHAALALQLDETNQPAAAAPLFERAYRLNEKLPEARDGLARRRIAEGRLDDARALVDHLEQPGAGQRYPLHTMYLLAEAYEKAGRHEEALLLCQHLVRELPNLEQNRDFRKLVRQAEKGSHRAESLFPERKSWFAIFNPHSLEYSSGQRLGAYVVALLILAAAGLAALNEYFRQHRTVVVRNEFGPAAQVVIDGDTVVPPGRQQKVTLPEGTHHVSVTGALGEDFDLDVHTDYWGRWTHDPAWVVNVGGLTQLAHYTVYYAENPRPTDAELIAGENVYFLPHVDYLFVPSPDTLQLDSKAQEVTKHELGVLNEAPNDVFQHLLANASPDAALRYAESALIFNPADNDLLATYYGAALGAGEEARAKNLLKSQLERRPVLVNWHRYYQELNRDPAESAELVGYYDQQLAQNPHDAVLLYLRGRLAHSNRESEAYFDRAKAADPKFSWPWAATGYVAYTQGDWQKCKENLQQAKALGHEDDLQPYLVTARLGLGEVAALEREYRAEVGLGPPEEKSTEVLMLTSVLIVKGDPAEARRFFEGWAGVLPADQNPEEFLEEYRGLLEFTGGDMAAVERRVRDGKASDSLKLAWLVSTGRPAQAADDPALAPLLDQPWKALSLSLAFALAGDQQAAATWRNKAADALTQAGGDEAQAAKLLRSNQPPSKDALDDIGIAPAEKSLLATVLATRFPQEHARYAALAKHLSVQPNSYSPLIKQAVDRAQPAAAAEAPGA